ncbi:MAG: hypothetical protein ACE5GG_04325, partial [Candidatus Omnitrophota bacterium]
MFFSCLSAVASGETITLTTYYPSPYGVYARLHSDAMAVGSAYRGNTPPKNGLIVEGNVGIGTAAPSDLLALHTNNGDPVLRFSSSGFSGNNGSRIVMDNGDGSLDFWASVGGNAPEMTITPSGEVGIGTAAPSDLLTLHTQNGDPVLRFTSFNYASFPTIGPKISLDDSDG